jgi:hypothetical protein
MSPYENNKPEWAFWCLLPAVKMWEAVALSLDIDPRQFLPHPAGGGSGGVAVSLIQPPIFSERLDLANRCFGGEPLPAVQILPGGEPKVTLQAFTRWAIGIGWPVPQELVALAGDPAEDAPNRNAKPFMPTGAPGRPSRGMHVVRAEFDRRRTGGECEPSLRQEATALQRWFHQHYPDAGTLTVKTIENNIRADYKRQRCQAAE